MGALLNVAGLATGVALYALLFAMVVQARHGMQRRTDPLLLLTAVLGLVWNLCTVVVFEPVAAGAAGRQVWAAIGFGALGLLPAVVLHSVLRGDHPGSRGLPKTVLTVCPYMVGGVGALLQAIAAVRGTTVPSPFAMRLLTYGFAALALPVGLATRRQPGSRRALWIAALAVFAVSALHLRQLHATEASWPVEVLAHNASLPLALAILYQDYPFAFADLFLKRALVVLGSTAASFVAMLLFAHYSESFRAFLASSPEEVGAFAALWVATSLLFPSLRRFAAWFVDSIVLRRADYRSLRAAIQDEAGRHDTIDEVLDAACAQLAPALSATAVSWCRTTAMVAEAGPLAPLTDADAHRATISIPTADSPQYAIAVQDLTGGRRLLSDDLATLESISVLLARRIDAIRISNERFDRARREQDVRRLATEAELRALRAQINPHFLFNALTTIGYLIQEAPGRALETLMRLTALLRAVLRSEGEFTTLGAEIDLVSAYLGIEQARFEERLAVVLDVPEPLRAIRLPSLVLQPLTENAVKHGIAHKQAGGRITLRARTNHAVRGRPQLIVLIEDTGAGTTAVRLSRGRQDGFGLRNIERRLHHHYGPAASLDVRSTEGVGTTVELRVPLVAVGMEVAG
jgi:anti-sigma regulatory factor (Ser/Thr protein kinase)